MCKYCEEEWPMTPCVADVPGMDIEMLLEAAFNIDAKERMTYLVISNVRTLDEARFMVANCPMCGRKLEERWQ